MRWGEGDKITEDKEVIFMDIGSAFPSKYLKASDLKGHRVTVQISGLEMEEIQGEKEAKPILYFANKNKGLVLNKTNSNMLVEITGESETDNWMGEKIMLYSSRVEFKGRIVDAIRIDRVGMKKQAPPLQEQEDFLGEEQEKPYEGDDAPF